MQKRKSDMEAKDFKKILLWNNLRTLGIQAVALVSAFVLIFVGGIGGEGMSWAGVLLAAPITLVVYVVLGYRFLESASKYNVLSVLGIAVLFGVISLISFLNSLTYPYVVESALAILNFPAAMIVDIAAYNLLRILDFTYPQTYPFNNFINITAAFIPSLFMYLGLCLKIWQHKRKQS